MFTRNTVNPIRLVQLCANTHLCLRIILFLYFVVLLFTFQLKNSSDNLIICCKILTKSRYHIVCVLLARSVTKCQCMPARLHRKHFDKKKCRFCVGFMRFSQFDVYTFFYTSFLLSCCYSNASERKKSQLKTYETAYLAFLTVVSMLSPWSM